eukprot:1865468-Prymnesium_polylepis.3
MSKAVACIEAHRDLMSALGIQQTAPSPVHCDNSAAVAIAAAAASFKRSLYMHRRVDFIQKASQRKAIRVIKVDTADNKADVLTKVLPPRQFAKIRDKMQNVKHGVRVATHARARTVRFPR